MYSNSIIKKQGKLPGKTIAVFAGVHGNEKVGIVTLKKIIPNIEIVSGTVYFVFANPPAIEQNKRIVNKNLNRLFSRDLRGDTYEDKRAHELMDLLDTCDALLDIHSYNSPTGSQFAISEKRGFPLLKKMNFPIVVTGFSSLGNGTDGYMEKQKKIGICVECGTTKKYKQFISLAEDTIYQFLQHFKCIESKVPFSVVDQKYVKAKRIIYKKSRQFKFMKEFTDFERLSKDSIFATDSGYNHKASKNECILFPREKAKIGEEVCIIGEFIKI
ncbi:MAG: succinylglutamate desuccinylase/aspartoacylase family protein [Candidatus Paceibacterota bacterium]